MSTFLKQLKSQYPKAALTASLISVNDGQYVVRAAISQDGQEIASGLAASVDVQVAEDKARERAIAILGIEPDSESASEPISQSAIAQQPSTATTEQASDRQPTETLKPIPHSDIDSAVGAEASADEAPLEEEDLGPPIDSVQEVPSAESQSEQQPSAATIALESFNTSATPVDLSDVIAQTDVELARLGWTSAQGREYLEKTYGKRSRQQLTDDELMAFLLYLEDLS